MAGPKATLRKFILMYESRRGAAKALGIAPAAIYQWESGTIPLHQALEIQRLTEGAIQATDLRPDIRKSMRYYRNEP